MSWVKAASLSADLDLAAMSAYLHQQGVNHRISEESGAQVIWVQHGGHAAAVLELVEGVSRGDVQFNVSESAADNNPASSNSWVSQTGRFPATLCLLVLAIFGALLVEFNPSLSLVRWLTYQDIHVVGNRLGLGTVAQIFSEGQYWRLVTPIFLHFSLFHILFNSLWLWEFGRRLEGFLGRSRFLSLVLFTGIASNSTQYFWQGPSLFGGMSGVLYGLLGYLWIRNRLQPDPRIALPSGVIIFMLVWLLVAASGFVDMFIGGSVANAAHVGGLLAGMLAAFAASRDRP